jgi:hypothetical protein
MMAFGESDSKKCEPDSDKDSDGCDMVLIIFWCAKSVIVTHLVQMASDAMTMKIVMQNIMAVCKWELLTEDIQMNEVRPGTLKCKR